MPAHERHGRRVFLRHAGMTALFGAAGGGVDASSAGPSGAGSSGASDPRWAAPLAAAACITWVSELADLGTGLPGAPRMARGAAEQSALAATGVAAPLHRWGYLDPPAPFAGAIVDWQRRRHGGTAPPRLLVHSDRVHPAVLGSLGRLHTRREKIVVQAPAFRPFFSNVRLVACSGPGDALPLDAARGVDGQALRCQVGADAIAVLLCRLVPAPDDGMTGGDVEALEELRGRRRLVVLYGILS